MKQVVITGTGRAGTTLLMSIFTKLGMDTGFSQDSITAIESTKSKGGLEQNITDSKNHIIKSPHLYNQIYQLENIDHVIIPMRNLENSAKSRARIGDSDGGFWGGASDVESQMQFNCEVIYSLMYSLCDLDIPFTLLQFPRLAKDTNYLWQKLDWLFTHYNITHSEFSKVCNQTINNNYIHFEK